MLKLELQRAEGELEDRCWSPPVGLQHWLQLTHEVENKSYMKKKISAEKQLQSAREAVNIKMKNILKHILRKIELIECFICSVKNCEKNDRAWWAPLSRRMANQ